MAKYVPGMAPRSTGQNLLLGSAYLLLVTVLLVVLANVATSFRPVRGC